MTNELYDEPRQAVRMRAMSEAATRRPTFFPLTKEVAQIFLENRITRAETQLWMWLVSNDPFGDRYLDLPSPTELGEILGITRQTVHSASARLEELGLYTFRIKKWEGRNLQGSKSNSLRESKNNFTLVKNSLEDNKKLALENKEFYDRTLEPPLGASSETLQIYTDLLKKEREIRANSFFEEIPSLEQVETLATEPESQAIEETFEKPICETVPTQEGKRFAAADSENFKTCVSFEIEAESCNWAEYACPGWGGSPRAYYEYQRAKTVLLAAERERLRAEGKRCKLIPEVDAYTRAVIRNGSEVEYQDWVREGRPTEPIAVTPKAARQTRSTPPEPAPLAPPLLSPDNVRENRNKALQALYEHEKFGEMEKLLQAWLKFKDGSVHQLLKECPDWGFSIKHEGKRARLIRNLPLSSVAVYRPDCLGGADVPQILQTSLLETKL